MTRDDDLLSPKRALLDQLGGGTAGPPPMTADADTMSRVQALKGALGGVSDPNSPLLGQPRDRVAYPVPGLQAGAGSPTASPFAFSQSSVMDILNKYAPTPEGLSAAFKENPQLEQSGSRIANLKSGKILDPTTGRIVDVGQAFGAGGGKGWWWGDDVGGGQPQGGQMGGGVPGLTNAIGGLDALLQGDPMAKIQQALQQVNRPNFEALLARLNGGQ